VIVLEAGQAVPADVRLVETVEARTVEATLTGESAPVSKDAVPTLAAETPLADRRNMMYRGTTLVDGAARALVVETGLRTEVGRIGTLIGGLPDEATPLERRLAVLGRRLAVVALSVAALVATLGLLQGRGWSDVLQLALALGIAAVPEGLPVVATVALAIGMRRMARRRALVRRLAVVETLGSTTVVCTDKTGTLTTGEMTATTFVADGREIAVTGAGYLPHGVFHELGAPVDPAERPLLNLALRIGVLASSPQIVMPAGEGVPPGDPTEIALVVAAAKGGLDATRVRTEAGTLVAQKAPVRLLSRTGASIQLSRKKRSAIPPTSPEKSWYASSTTCRAWRRVSPRRLPRKRVQTAGEMRAGPLRRSRSRLRTSRTDSLRSRPANVSLWRNCGTLMVPSVTAPDAAGAGDGVAPPTVASVPGPTCGAPK